MRGLMLLFLCAASPTLADVKGPQGDAPVFRYVYPSSASPEAIDKLHRDDLKSLRDETAKLQELDGGSLSADHKTYLATRQTAIERRYSEALAGTTTAPAN